MVNGKQLRGTLREGLQLCLQLPVSFKENPNTFNKNHSVMFGKDVSHVILGSLGSVAQFSFKQIRTKEENYVFAECSGAHRLGQVITLSWLEDQERPFLKRYLGKKETVANPSEVERISQQLKASGRIIGWPLFDNMHHQWLLLAACFWVIFMFMVASKFITLTFKDPDGYSAKQEFVFLTAMPEAEKLRGEKHFSEVMKPTGKMLSESRPDQPPVYLERLELIRNACKEEALRNLSHTKVSKFVLDRIFVCDKHKILFCQTPKVGNTQWKKVLIVLNGAFSSIEEIPENVVHDHEKNGLPRLSSFSKIGIQKRLKTYFKFFIVRDPFERLISAFKDKFVHNPRFEPWYRHEIAPGIIRKYRKNRTETRGIQFEDFVRYLGDPNRRWLDLQFGDHIIHWVTYVKLCAPCEIKYSVIGHHETLEADAPYILKEAGIDHLVSYPTIPPGITMYNRTKVEQYFLGISKRDIRRLYARFEGDFKLFGYQKPDFLLN